MTSNDEGVLEMHINANGTQVLGMRFADLFKALAISCVNAEKQYVHSVEGWDLSMGDVRVTGVVHFYHNEDDELHLNIEWTVQPNDRSKVQ